jgi:DinB superfamily
MSDLADTLERFRRGPELLAVVLTGVHGDEIDFTTAAGKWSIRTITAHLADTELVAANRMRQVIAEDKPPLMAFDQDAWARNLDYARRLPKQSLETFRRLRAENYELLKALPEAAFERAGVHSQRGPLTLRQLLNTFADHTESHARQMQAIRDQYEQARGKK